MKCPKCGNEEFYINQRVSGIVEYHYRFDSGEGDNGELHEPLNYTDTGKFAYCPCCRKRLFRYRNQDLEAKELKYKVRYESKPGMWECYTGVKEVDADSVDEAIDKAYRLIRRDFPDRPQSGWYFTVN